MLFSRVAVRRREQQINLVSNVQFSDLGIIVSSQCMHGRGEEAHSLEKEISEQVRMGTTDGLFDMCEMISRGFHGPGLCTCI